MSSLKQRLEEAMAGPPRVSAAELARACGVKPPSVSDWLNGKTKALEGANLLLAAAKLQVRPEWLAGLGGPMRGLRAGEKSQATRLDVPKLATLIETVDGAITTSGRNVSAKARARLVAALYADETGNAPDAAITVRTALVSLLTSLEEV